MFAVDTNVVSEITRPKPDRGVVLWFEQTARDSIYLPSVVIAELFAGIEAMPTGKKRSALSEFLTDFVSQAPESNVLGFGFDEAIHYARIVTLRRQIGREIKQFDAQIAAIAAANQMRIVTRNVRDFEHCGIELINPWESAT